MYFCVARSIADATLLTPGSYTHLPELSDGYIKMNMEQMTQEAVEEADQELDSSFTTSLDLADSMNSYFSTLENLPEADLVTSILTRYTDIIFDNVADAENPGAQEAVAGDVSQELSVLEGHVTQEMCIRDSGKVL